MLQHSRGRARSQVSLFSLPFSKDIGDFSFINSKEQREKKKIKLQKTKISPYGDLSAVGEDLKPKSIPVGISSQVHTFLLCVHHPGCVNSTKHT